jgi:hypothetical protein
MSKSFEKFNSTHTILGEVKCNEYNHRQFNFLTNGIKEKEELFAMILDEASCIGEAVIRMKRLLVELGERGNVSLEQLQSAKNKDELYSLICELFVEKFPCAMLNRLLDEFTVEQIFNYRKNQGYTNPVRLLTFNKDYAINRFCLN